MAFRRKVSHMMLVLRFSVWCAALKAKENQFGFFSLCSAQVGVEFKAGWRRPCSLAINTARNLLIITIQNLLHLFLYEYHRPFWEIIV